MAGELFKTGERAGSATAEQLDVALECRMVKFFGRSDNVGNVYIGGSDVTTPDGSDDSTTGIQVLPGQETGWIPCTNLRDFYYICDNATDDFIWLASMAFY